MKTRKCCICNRKFYGWGNNPDGALDMNNKVIKWKDSQVCCDECNYTEVITGRLYLMNKKV